MPSTLPSETTEVASATPVSDSIGSISDEPTIMTPTSTSVTSKKHRKILKIVLAVVVVVVLVLVAGLAAIGVHAYSLTIQLQEQARTTTTAGKAAYEAFKKQDLKAVESNLAAVEQSVQSMKATYAQLGYLQYVPIASSYYADGNHAFAATDAGLSATKQALGAISPYADVLGFGGEGSFTGGTAEDRLKLILQTLQKISPQLDDIATEVSRANDEIAQIDPARYPENIQDQPVRQLVTQAHTVASGAAQALTQYRPVIERLPSIAGATGTRKKYLVLFQNDNELRPTGGFLTAYAIINVDNGKVEAEKSDDIYELDKKFPKKVAIPPKLGKYLTTEKMWNLRDMNIDPDFKLSMDSFIKNYFTIKGEPTNIDGVIAVDTEVLTQLMKVTGDIDVPGYGKFSAQEDSKYGVPQIIYALSEIITRPTPYIRENRKGILGPLMRSLLTKIYLTDRAKFPELFQIGFNSIEGRHVQLYLLDKADQQAAELLGAAGRMVPKPGEDFMAIVNANLGGAKSNLYITYDVKQEVSAPTNGMVAKNVEITYKNNKKGDNCNLEAGLLCLNSTNRDWTRIYLPVGSKVEKSQGFTSEPETYEENGFTVVDGFHILEPNSTAKIILTYQVPYTDPKTYKLLQWKQGGIKGFEMLMDVNGNQEKVMVTKDLEYQTQF